MATLYRFLSIVVLFRCISCILSLDALVNTNVTLFCDDSFKDKLNKVKFLRWYNENGGLLGEYMPHVDPPVVPSTTLVSPNTSSPSTNVSLTSSKAAMKLTTTVPILKEESPIVADVPHSDTYILDKLRTLSLTVLKLNKEDTGSYRCEYQFDDIHGNRTLQLHVRDRPKINVTVISEHTTNTSFHIDIAVTDWWKSHVSKYTVYVRNSTHPVEVRRINDPDTKIVVDKEIEPFTLYTVSVEAFSDLVDLTANTSVTTKEGIPALTVTIHKRGESTNTTASIEWSYGYTEALKGVLKGFLVTVVPKIPVVGDVNNVKCDTRLVNNTFVLNTTVEKYAVHGLKPNTTYNISVQIGNNAGYGPKTTILVNTKDGWPDAPKLIEAASCKQTSCTIRWDPPRCSNGVILRFTVRYCQSNKCRSSRYLVRQFYVRNGMVKDFYRPTITRLFPYTEYNFWVVAESRLHRSNESNKLTRITDTSEPSKLSEVSRELHSNDSVKVMWLRPGIVYRNVELYTVRYTRVSLFGKKKYQPEYKNIMNEDTSIKKSTIIGGLKSQERYKFSVRGGTKSIIATDRIYWSVWSEWSKPILIGEDKSLEDKRATDNSPGTSSLAVGLSIGAVFIVLFTLLGFGIGRYILSVRRNKADLQVSYEEPIGEMEPMLLMHYREDDLEAIPMESWAEHVKQLHANSDLQFSQEYDDINTCYLDINLSSHCSLEPENRPNNRYINILAYDHSRVKLEGRENYINANYVDGYQKTAAYIAAQGPLVNTVEDFWRMIWEQGSPTIIMITNLTEKGRLKCNKYWPEHHEETYGHFTVTHLKDKQVVMAHYTVRFFKLRNHKARKKQDRIIRQYHYTDWPDHGTPAYTLPVLDFVHCSASTSTSGPVVVHCSAGVGRTGTYIVIDTMIRQIQDRGTVNVRGFLRHIRKQRNFLVQTEEQYIFIHDALVEHIQSGGYTSVMPNELEKHIQHLNTPFNDNSDETLLKKYFQLATEHEAKDYECLNARLNYNSEKNRCNDIVSVDICRVILPKKPGVEGSDYINATFLQGFSKSKEFIITQHPQKTRIDDFWKMVWDQNSKLIVMLSPLGTEDFEEFWSEKDQVMDFEHFKVTFTTENMEKLDYVTRDFLLEASEDDYELESQLISTTCWPDSCTNSTAFNLVKECLAYQKKASAGPIIVIDKYGGREAALFCALCTLYLQLEAGIGIDIYSLTKLYHLKRPGLFSSHEDYHFLYKAVFSIVNDPSIKDAPNTLDVPSDVHLGKVQGSIKREGSILRTKSPSVKHRPHSLKKSESSC